jgi:fibro-slime domain-containing protein
MTKISRSYAASLLVLVGAGQALAEAKPDTITITGVLRDFRESKVPGGHPDFEVLPDAGGGHYMGNVADTLDADGKPVFTGLGHKIDSQWTTADGQPIHPSLYDPSLGDIPGSLGVADDGGITDEQSFRQWFRDVPGVNMSGVFPITLEYDAARDTYIFDDRLATHFAKLDGFFPVNDKMFGNSQGGNKNFHFTYELQTEFVYQKGSGQTFKFRGDDDVWVFIDGRLVIDIGGVHTAIEQVVELDRLDWLEDGETYPLSFFFAERKRTQSNFRIETSLHLRTGEIPTTTAMWD